MPGRNWHSYTLPKWELIIMGICLLITCLLLLAGNRVSQAAAYHQEQVTPSGTHTSTPSQTASVTALPSSTVTPSTTHTASSTAIPSGTNTPTPSQTASVTALPSSTVTSSAAATICPSDTPTITLTPIAGFVVVINEVAWAGTLASSYDEWIELYNPGDDPVDLGDWLLMAADGSPRIELMGVIPAGGYFLLERTDDTTVANISADLIYTGTLSNAGEILYLTGPAGEIIDAANVSGGEWLAGDAKSRASMERAATYAPEIWGTYSGDSGIGLDAAGNPIAGTPKGANSVWFFTPTPTASSTLTPTASPTITPTPTPCAPQDVLINEIAWAGTIGHYNDEWIELYNPREQAISLDGWQLTAADGTPDINLQGEIPAWGYFILERTDESTINNIPANQIYSGSMSNDGETLYLLSPTGEIVDAVSPIKGAWPAGSAARRASMERRNTTPEGISTWQTNTGYVMNGIDTDGYPIRGTPGQRNSIEYPTPTPTLIPTGALLRINEFLPHPKYDWNGDGLFTTGDEFIEIINAGSARINVVNWILDDGEDGSRPFTLPDLVLEPGQVAVFFRSDTRIAFSDSSDAVRLLTPDGEIIDERTYIQATTVNLSWCRLIDGITELVYPCWPTPGDANATYPLTGSMPGAPAPTSITVPPCPPSGWLLPKNWRVCGPL